MWEHPLTLRHLRQLAADRGADVPAALDLASVVDWINRSCPRLRIVPPQSKRLACGDIGVGALATVEEIMAFVTTTVPPPTSWIEESTTYREMVAKGETIGKTQGLAEGALKEAKRVLVILARNSLGEPDETTRSAIQATSEVNQVEQLIDMISEVSSWAELFGKLTGARRGKKKS